MLTKLIQPKQILLLVGLLLVPGTICGEELSWGQKMFAKQNVDFGVVARGADVSYRIPLENIYQETINIVDIRTGCSCITATASKMQLLSGEKGYLEVKLDTVRFSKERKSQVIVSLSMEAPQGGAGTYQQVTIPVLGYIRTDVVLTPGAAAFGSVAEGTELDREILLQYAGRNDWKVTNVKSKNPNLNIKWEEASRGQDGTVNYNLKVSLKPNAPKGDLRERVIIETNDENNPEIPLLVEASVESEYTIAPSSDIHIGTLSPGQSKTLNVVIKGRKPFSIEKMESDSGSPAFEMVLPKTTNVVHVIRLVVTAPTSPGPLKETFTVSVTGSEKPLSFNLTGKITEAATAQTP